MTPSRSRPRRPASPPALTAPPRRRWASSPRSGPQRCSRSTASTSGATLPKRSSPRASSCPRSTS
eukprot:11868432-Alexandrium_andersonii.AAC.1